MTRKFLSGLSEDGGGESVPAGEYEIEVVDSRTIETSEKTIFVDLKVIGGPEDGRVVSVSLYCPDDDEKGAKFHFSKKVRAFARRLAAIDPNLSDSDFVPAIAEALIGGKGIATLGVQKSGQYAGSQELLATRPVADVGVDPMETEPTTRTTSF